MEFKKKDIGLLYFIKKFVKIIINGVILFFITVLGAGIGVEIFDQPSKEEFNILNIKYEEENKKLDEYKKELSEINNNIEEAELIIKDIKAKIEKEK